MIVSWFPRKNAPCFCTHTSFLFWALMNCRSLMKICWMGNYRIFFSLPLILTRDRIFSTLFFPSMRWLSTKNRAVAKYWQFWSITEIKFIAVQFQMIYWYLFAFYVFCLCYALQKTIVVLAHIRIRTKKFNTHSMCYFLLKCSLNSFILCWPWNVSNLNSQ